MRNRPEPLRAARLARRSRPRDRDLSFPDHEGEPVRRLAPDEHAPAVHAEQVVRRALCRLADYPALLNGSAGAQGDERAGRGI